MDTWNNPPEELEDDCKFCGEPSNGRYCSSECKKAYESEN
jgi:hypothetical protein